MRDKMKYILRLLIIIMLNVFIIALVGHTYRMAAAPGSAQALSGIGSRGDEVRSIQEKLKQAGLYDGEASGFFDGGTAGAVKDFQRLHGLTVDGIADPATMAALGLGPSRSVGGIPDSDYQLLARLISAEAGEEPYIGQAAVGAVILNRLEHPSFPDTLAGVIYQPGAFAAVTGGRIDQPAAASAYRAAKDALSGSDPTGGAIYYYDPFKASSNWLLSRPVILTIGSYAFCA